jgi:cytochrome P450
MRRAVDPDPPGPRTIGTLAAIPRFRREPFTEILAINDRYGPLVCSRFLSRRFYSVCHPDHVRHILHDNHRNYVKGELIGRTRILIGNGLFSSEGDTWRQQRRIIQPTFHRQRVASLASMITDATIAMLARWTRRTDGGVPFDVAAEMHRLTLDIAGQALFGVDLSGEGARIADALHTALSHVNHLVTSLFPIPPGLPSRRNLRFRGALRTLDDAVFRIIRQRRAGAAPDTTDLLSLLLAARDEETGEVMSDRQLRDEVMTFFLAGHETTALALTWALYGVATNPDVEAQLRAEAERVLAGRVPVVDDLTRLPYTRAVLDETLRLYPPVWAFAREAIADDRIGGYRIRAGSPVAILPYLTHRLRAFWDDPERFDPERFSPGRVAERPRYAYLPFGGGPRQCIGNEFALMEAHLILPMIARDYRLVIEDGRSVRPEANLTLRPRGGLIATMHRVADPPACM